MNRNKTFWTGCLLFLIISGCGIKTQFSHQELPGLPKMKLAVLPFENLAQHPHAGIIASQLIMTQLYKSDKFILQKENTTRKLLRENKIDFSKLADNYYVAALGEKLGVEAVMAGSASEYKYQHGLGQNAAVGFNARLIEVKSARVLWAGSYSKVGSGFLYRDSLNNVAHEIAEEMIDDMVEAMTN